MCIRHIEPKSPAKLPCETHSYGAHRAFKPAGVQIFDPPDVAEPEESYLAQIAQRESAHIDLQRGGDAAIARERRRIVSAADRQIADGHLLITQQWLI